ncbi:cytochrome P450 [Streptomyces sp. NPDC002845]
MTSIPTAPGRLPLLGHITPLMRDPLTFLTSLPAHGDLVRIGLGPFTAVVVCDPELAQHVFLHDRVFEKGGQFLDRAREAIGDGVSVCPYSVHRRLRRLMQPAFHPDRLRGYAASMTEQAAAVADSWRPGRTVDLIAEMPVLTATTTAATLFSTTVPESTLREMLDDVTDIFYGVFRRTMMPPLLDRLPTPGNRAFERAISRMRAALNVIIAERRAEDIDHGDLLSAVLFARDTSGNGLDDDEVCAQIVNFFLAGTETTAAALEWALYLLDQHPDIADRLHAEVDTVLAGRPARYDDLPRLELTRRIVLETLRIRPPIFFTTRTLPEAAELAGHPLPAGTTIVVSAYLIHHRPDLYPDPDTFAPDRWPTTAGRTPRSTFIPFSGGARKCIGDDYAITQATITLATIAARWQLHTLPGQDLRIALSAALRPRELRMRATPRTP